MQKPRDKIKLKLTRQSLHELLSKQLHLRDVRGGTLIRSFVPQVITGCQQQ